MRALYANEAELCLSKTYDVLGGSSSNIGRLVALLRAAKGKDPESTFSVDWQKWDPMRRGLQASEGEEREEAGDGMISAFDDDRRAWRSGTFRED